MTQQFNQQTMDKVDELVKKHFYDPKADKVWQATLALMKPKILASKDLAQLGENINEALHALNASHTQFVTTNDETFYFLHTLFAQRRQPKSGPPPSIDYVGAITGGVHCPRNQVRYVLDGSPAAAAGIKQGDSIVSVNGRPYIGQLSFHNTADKQAEIVLNRPGQGPVTVSLKPLKKNEAQMYVDAIHKSIKITKHPEGTIGYVHLWTGGEKSHDAIEYALSDDLQKTDGLVLDMRDGYGGNFFDDLDFLFRPKEAYPSFSSWDRSGKRFPPVTLTYDKPVVALINGGSRSGKELLAYSLKKTGRGTLVGERTAGAVLGGRLFRINDRTALYLAVSGVDVEGKTFEGNGVQPDVEVKQTCEQAGKEDLQLAEAIRILREKLTTPARPQSQPL